MKAHCFLPRVSRRQFIGALGQTAVLTCAGSALLPARAAEGASNSCVGSNIYGWTQYFQREGRPFDPIEVMIALRDGGFDYLEGFMDLAAPEKNLLFAEQLKAHGLKPVTLYTGGNLHDPAMAKTTVNKILLAAEGCRKAGFFLLSCNPDPIGREKTDAELKTQVSALNDLGAGLKSIGVKLGVHQHLPELVSKAREFHSIFQNTQSDVGWCYDVHWLYRGGLLPGQVLPVYGNRVVSWHLRQSRGGVWWEDLDQGDIDYAEVARYARQHQLPRHFTVELALENGTAVTRSAFANHQRSREFVRRVFAS
jgi:inosose dehydratase